MALFKTAVLLAALMGLFLVIGLMLGGITGLIIAGVLGLGMNFFAYWQSDKLALRMAGAKEASQQEQPQLHRAVEEMAAIAGLPKPRVYIIENDAPNAFATGRNPEHAAVAATTGIIRLLTDRELRAVMAHELGHVKNRDILISTMVATIAGAISMIAFISLFFRNSRSSYGFIAVIVAWIIAPLVAGIIQAAISRTPGYQADMTGAELSHDPVSLATALEKLHQGVKERPMEATPMAESTAHLYIVHPFKAGGIANLFSTHPPVEERVKRLRDLAYKRN